MALGSNSPKAFLCITGEKAAFAASVPRHRVERKMEQKVRTFVKQYHLLEEGDRIVLGLSGGMDSMCLLFLLLQWRKERKIEILAVHVDHQIRGEAAREDAAFVERICKEEKVEYRLFQEDVKGLAQKKKLSVEEAGREIRRELLQREQKRWGGSKIALAHHRNDHAETLLFHLARGCGLKGLGGIAPVEGQIIRPLLCLERREIEAYVKQRQIPYREDATNQDLAYARNRIRRQILPELETVNEKALLHFWETSQRAKKAWEFLEKEADRWYRLCREKEKERLLLKEEEYRKIPEELREYVLQKFLWEGAGKRKDITAVHIRLLEELWEKQSGRKYCLPYRLDALRTPEGIELYPAEKEEGRRPGEEKPPAVQMRIFEKKEEVTIFPQNPYTKWFDYDKIESNVKIRHREAGDYLTIDRAGGRQKLKQYFINEKIPQRQRDAIWLAADGQHILWVIGYRQNQGYQVTDKTKRILEIKVDGGNHNGRAD